MCVFCDIEDGSAPAHVVLRDEPLLVFLDRRPLFPGHCLVIPRRHHETISDLPRELIAPLFEVVQSVARAVTEAMDAEGTFIAMNNRVSQSVPHLHVHVVPRRKGDGLKGFFWPRRGYRDDEEMARTAAAISAHIPRADIEGVRG